MNRLNQLLQRFQRLTTPAKIGVIVGFAVVTTAIWYFLLTQSQLERLDSVRAELTSVEASLAEKQLIADNLNERRREMDLLDQRLQEALTQLPEQKDIEDLLTQLNEVGRRSGLEIRSVTPGAEESKSFYTEIPIAISIVGNFHEVAMFLQEISHLRRIVNVSNLKLSSPTQPRDKVVVAGEFLATAFRFAPQQEAKKDKPAAGAKGTP